MQAFRIDKQKWNEGLKSLYSSYRLCGPRKEGRYHIFRELDADQQPDLDFQNTRLSAKSLAYPQSQVMFNYTLNEDDPKHHQLQEVFFDETPRAVIGIRPCDASAFGLVKRNFDSGEYQDSYWIKAYAQTCLIGLACTNPCRTCFCTTAGSGPFDSSNLDVLLVDIGKLYLAQCITPKGESFLATAGWDIESAPEAENTIQSMRTKAEAQMVSRIDTDQLHNKSTMELYEAPFWEDVAFACINCGTCTYLCPTCWCFDIQDEVCGKSGLRMRNWDSCMSPLFTLHGTGHNPRSQKIQRVRQRFMHKLKYYVDKYGDGIQCVGCGRCVQYCPVNIDIREVCNLMNDFGSPSAASQLSA